MSITITNKIIIEEAKKYGINHKIISDKHNLIALIYKDKEFIIRRAITPATNAVSYYIANHKEATYRILDHYGFSIPKTISVSSFEEAKKAADEIVYPVVVKPEDGAHGEGVTINVIDEKMLQDSYDEAFNIHKKDILIQNYIPGDDYRVMIVDYKVIAIAKRVPCNIFGDGKSTITQLIEKENKNPLRGEGHQKPMTLIVIDNHIEQFLQSQNLSLDSIPKDGEQIFLRENANLSTGGEAYDVTDSAHKDNIEILNNISKALNARITGLDIRCIDIKKKFTKNNYAVIETNVSPGIRMHHFPSKGKSRNIAYEILKLLFPKAIN